KVAADGVEFAMIRAGYRTMESGQIVEDTSAKYNMQEATVHGIKVGVYFFSTAITEEEAIEEAQWVADFIAQYPITYPVVYDCENYENPKSRQFHLTKEERTELAKVFLNTIYELGYTPMFYASRNELLNDNKWLTTELEKSYKIWLSWYTGLPYPQTEKADYSGAHSMWQYTNNGTISGVNAPVDINVAYFGYETAAAPKDSTPPERVEADVEAGHTFTEVDETVTAKDATNLRNIPSQGNDSQIMLTLQNGQTATRTGISSSGWSRVIYNGETYYAVSSLLTTDLTVKAPEPVPRPEENTSNSEDGIQTEFIACDETVMAKIEVNLRNIPSVTSEKSTVVATAHYGETFRRVGINEELGWSKVEYNGQTLYCVSSYIYVYEVPVEE
ncbi:MAG: glycoside hydrolase family 25, partial [Lachnospiraceae bacterium]|nr:glycoside hydrolase family 25 [Lachnospiraceae bacterium]